MKKSEVCAFSTYMKQSYSEDLVVQEEFVVDKKFSDYGLSI